MIKFKYIVNLRFSLLMNKQGIIIPFIVRSLSFNLEGLISRFKNLIPRETYHRVLIVPTNYVSKGVVLTANIPL